jgi:hypothetical protein
LQRRMLGIQSPRFKNSLRQVLLREDYFPLDPLPHWAKHYPQIR